jgi:hypothetical protein
MMTTSVDWKSVGLDVGSNTDELDWNDWKRPVISLLRAKLLRNRTFTKYQFSKDNKKVTRISHKIRNGSIEKDEKRVLLGRTLETVNACYLSTFRWYRENRDEKSWTYPRNPGPR